MIRRVASAFLVGGLLSSSASAQTTPAPAPAPPSAPVPTQPTAKPTPAPAAPAPAASTAKAPASFRQPIPTDPAHPDYHAGAHRTIVRHNPLPQRTSYNAYYSQGKRSSGDPASGYSTGGVGRYAEYYDSNTPMDQVDRHPNPIGRFDSGGGPSRDQQIAAYRAGTQRSAALQNHLDSYGRPYGAYGAGFGYGLGLGGGRLYTYPY